MTTETNVVDPWANNIAHIEAMNDPRVTQAAMPILEAARERYRTRVAAGESSEHVFADEQARAAAEVAVEVKKVHTLCAQINLAKSRAGRRTKGKLH